MHSYTYLIVCEIVHLLNKVISIELKGYPNDLKCVKTVALRQFLSNGHIVIFVVVKSSSDLNTEYEIAHSTLRCYCAARHYPLVILDFSNNSTLSALCPQRDFMFRRHCALAHFLSDNPTKIEWVLFLDADIGVVNPSHLVEDYLPKTTSMDREQMIPDLVFYERIFNGEFVAGSYIARYY
uniref:Hexosyltransferase n=1 Tax=Meloidogyne hapla TaxID=6305 RepID=A0A1I8BY18_MELHA